MRWIRWVAAGLVAGCGAEGAIIPQDLYELEPQGTPVSERVEVIHDREELNGRVTLLDEVVPLVEDSLAGTEVSPSQDGIGSTGSGLTPERTYTLRLVARVAPPTTPGETPESEYAGEFDLQATSVSVVNGTAVVSYHQRGEIYAGGIDVLDVSDPSHPELTSFAHFSHLDVNSVSYVPARGSDGRSGYIYAASATCDPLYLRDSNSALVERIGVKSRTIVVEDDFEIIDGTSSALTAAHHLPEYDDRENLNINGDRRYSLLGWSGSAAVASPDPSFSKARTVYDEDEERWRVRRDSLLFAAGGEGGGLVVYDEDSELRIFETRLGDARWIDIEGDTVAVVSGGLGGGRLHTFAFDREGRVEQTGSFAFEGARTRLSRSTLQLAGGKAFIAAGAEGLRVLAVDSGRSLAHLPLPRDSGYDPEDVVTNAVSVDEDLAFLASGGLGLHLVQLSADPTTTGTDPVGLRVAGRLDVTGSANHVLYQDGYLYLASGTQGLLIIQVEVE